MSKFDDQREAVLAAELLENDITYGSCTVRLSTTGITASSTPTEVVDGSYVAVPLPPGNWSGSGSSTFSADDGAGGSIDFFPVAALTNFTILGVYLDHVITGGPNAGTKVTRFTGANADVLVGQTVRIQPGALTVSEA